MKKNHGFSYIELIVIIVIIAIVATLGVFITGEKSINNNKRLMEEAQSLYEVMRFAQEEALIRQRLIGFRGDASGDGSIKAYSWYQYENKQWQLIDGYFKRGNISEGIVLEIFIEDVLLEALLEEQLNTLQENEQLPPNIIFFPSGEISEFEIRLMLENDKEYELLIGLNERGGLSLNDNSEKQ